MTPELNNDICSKKKNERYLHGPTSSWTTSSPETSRTSRLPPSPSPLPSRPLMALCSHPHQIRPLASYGEQHKRACFLHVLGFSPTQHSPNSKTRLLLSSRCRLAAGSIVTAEASGGGSLDADSAGMAGERAPPRHRRFACRSRGCCARGGVVPGLLDGEIQSCCRRVTPPRTTR